MRFPPATARQTAIQPSRFSFRVSLEVTRRSSIRNNQSPLLSSSDSLARVKKGGVLVTNSAQVVPPRRVRYHGCHQPSSGIAMTTLEVKLKLPDILASQAQAAGLLTRKPSGNSSPTHCEATLSMRFCPSPSAWRP